MPRKSPKAPVEGASLPGRVRPLVVPDTDPRPSHYRSPEPHVEVSLSQVDAPEAHAIVPESEVEAARAALAGSVRDLPRLRVGADAGAVDLRLEDVVGSVVKQGVVVLQGPNGPADIPIDPSTRRFRMDGLAPGDYVARAVAGGDGRAEVSLQVRAGEVTRAPLVLDGQRPSGEATVELRVRGADEKIAKGAVRIRATDDVTGAVVLEGEFELHNGRVTLTRLPIGRIHIDISGLHDLRSCYDVDTDDHGGLRGPYDVQLIPRLKRRPIEPDPPDWFTELPPELHGTWPTVRTLGLGSITELAAAEPEALMHRALEAGVPMHSRAYATLVDAARTATLPGGAAVRSGAVTSTRGHLNSIYSSLAERNPGISVIVNDATLLPANIAGWVNHARTAMASLGVCSIDDLGMLRMQPMQKLHPGGYVAPYKTPTVPPVLHDWVFSHVINDTILRYLPNETLHQTAIVLASEWNIRGQTVVIGSNVRELLVIVNSIGYDAGTRITWEHATLPDGPAFWPSPAPPGAKGAKAGEAGRPGADGNQAPAKSQNGGSDAVVAAPIVTMFLRNATSGLPPIDLRGQWGGVGGRGQDGGHGGDGATGENADGTFFGGCCRGVGRGGAGGRGGNAGRGGEGGRGGAGGKLTILTTPPSIVAIDMQHPVLDIRPGGGGPGGRPGTAGDGGAGGPAGSADCEIWCSEHPERKGAAGSSGLTGGWGPEGPAGPLPLSDALQILPITDAQWEAEFNKPHILSASPLVVEPGEQVNIIGENFIPGTDRVYFDGTDVGPVASTTSASFMVPSDVEGGFHPAVIRSVSADRISNKVMIQVLPKVTGLSPTGRWTEGTAVTISGLAFRPGCVVTAEDWAATPHVLHTLPTGPVNRTTINLTVPPAPLGNLRGVRRIRVRNPDGGTSRGEWVTRIGDTIVVRIAAFRLVGSVTGTQTVRTAAEITSLFTEGLPQSISTPWGAARISFQLAQPVTNLSVPDKVANVFPMEGTASHPTWDSVLQPVFVPGAINILFARDVEDSTAYANFGGGPIVYGDEPGFTVTATDFQQIVAHEVGHVLCLRHVCSVGEGPGTFFDRACQNSDKGFLMYPNWNVSDGMALDPGQVPIARRGATYVESGKTVTLAWATVIQDNVPPRCATDDPTN